MFITVDATEFEIILWIWLSGLDFLFTSVCPNFFYSMQNLILKGKYQQLQLLSCGSGVADLWAVSLLGNSTDHWKESLWLR